VQLREKQKARRIYGVMEGQFRNYFKMADRQKGVTGENLIILLERRLDNTVFRLGFAGSRADARQLVRFKGRRPSAGAARARSGKRAKGKYPIFSDEARRSDRDPGEKPEIGQDPGSNGVS
jgi:hypothetical protein